MHVVPTSLYADYGTSALPLVLYETSQQRRSGQDNLVVHPHNPEMGQRDLAATNVLVVDLFQAVDRATSFVE